MIINEEDYRKEWEETIGAWIKKLIDEPKTREKLEQAYENLKQQGETK
jgi:hypothetical protein